MNRLVRFGSAALGMVLLAGLAMYQGNSELKPGEQDMMSGTALTEADTVDCVPVDDTDNEDCAEHERLADNDR